MSFNPFTDLKESGVYGLDGLPIGESKHPEGIVVYVVNADENLKYDTLSVQDPLGYKKYYRRAHGEDWEEYFPRGEKVSNLTIDAGLDMLGKKILEYLKPIIDRDRRNTIMACWGIVREEMTKGTDSLDEIKWGIEKGFDKLLRSAR